VKDDGDPISYQGVAKGTPMLTSSGHQFDTLEHVLQVPGEDLFDGIVVAAEAGLRFVDRDQVAEITTRCVRCDLDDAAARALPQPDGPPIYRVDALQYSGPSLHDRLGRLFRRPRWIDGDEKN
jgi:hypothetical protein